jgi:hypothetical protein
MRLATRTVFLSFLLTAMSLSGFSQLRNLSEYSQDCINADKTYFIFRDSGAPEFGWASEWTHVTANATEGKSAIFLWHFRDGSKAYSLQAEDIGEIGKNSGYLLANKSFNLEDVHRKKIQPLTRNNYPVKVELWIGKIENETGYTLEMQSDEACLNDSTIENNRTYHFSECASAGK